MYLDDLLACRASYTDDVFEKLTWGRKILVHADAALGLTIDAQEDETRCQFTLQTHAHPDINVFQLPPPVFPSRIIIATFELVSVDKVHVIFSGNTRVFQTAFVRMGIKGQSYKVDPSDEYSEYFRVVQGLELEASSGAAAFLKGLLGEECLKSSPVVLRAHESSHDNTLLAKLVLQLKDVSNVRSEVQFT